MAFNKTNYKIIQKHCKYMKLYGLGEYWHENSKVSSKRYSVFQGIIFLQMYVMTIFQILEIIFNTFPTDLHYDAFAMGLANVMVLARFHVAIYKRDKIREMHRFIVEDCKGYEEDEVLKKQHRKVVIAVILQSAVVVSTLSFYLFEGIRRKINENMPLIILTAYWPKLEDESYLATVARVGILITEIVLTSNMIALDSIVISHLILLSFKFVNLQRYFASIRRDFESGNHSILELKMKCLDGILLHDKLTSLSRKIHDCFGLMMSVQVFQGSAVAILLLMRLVLSSKLTVTVVIMNSNFVIGLLTQLALYLWNAGEVTYQAGEMSTAIFHCGWHTRGVRNKDELDLRRIVLMGCTQAQRPLVMKAFGFQDLSYGTFVSVVRTTYSLFAVLY